VRTLWTGLTAPAVGGVAAQPLADPVKEVEALAKAATDPALKTRIEGVGSVIKANIQARNEQRDRSARSEIRVGAYLARKVIEDRRKIASIESLVNGPLPENLKAEPRANLVASRGALDGTLNYMIDTLKAIGLDFPAATTAAQGEILKREFEARAVTDYAPLVDLVVRHSQDVRVGRATDKPALLSELAALDARTKKQ